jgi:N-acetylglucosaminyldiphosphoundecaprenol N-acetyl-beta-D-mannosaminyltransferase
MNILGVRIDNFSKKEILEKIDFFLSEDKFHQVATINPEFLLEAENNLEFKNILNNADLNVADGMGIKLAFWYYFQNLKYRFAGADLICEILKIANTKKLNVFLAINKDGLSSYAEIVAVLKNVYPEIIFFGKEYNFSHSSSVISHQDAEKIDYRLPTADDCILFCNFGAPFQEVFINSIKNDRIKLAIGVGGTFDFITKKIKRAPIFMQRIGLEWLWRLILEPRYRLKRVFKAVIVFPIKILFSR